MTATYSDGRTHNTRSAEGFTLLEIMISLAIIGITLTTVLYTVNHHSDILYENTLKTRMYQAAKEKMHELEKSRASTEGKLDSGFSYRNIVITSEDSDIVELKTIVQSGENTAVLRELILKGNGKT